MPLLAEKLAAPPSTNQIRRFFELSLEMAELSEALLEEQGAYSKKFLTGLKGSLTEQREGRLRQIESLAELRQA